MKQINNLSEQEREERLDRFNADVIDDIAIQEQNINPHDCDHTPNHLIPLRLEINPLTRRQILISKCTCCNAEIPEDYPLPYMDESMMN